MGTILASVLVGNARRLLQDVSNVAQRWSDATLLAGLNEAQRMVVLLKPDCNTLSLPVQLNGTPKQTLPANSVAFVKVTRNMGVAGTTPGRAISQIGMTAMDMADMDWHSAAVADNVIHCMVDPRVDREYYVWPPTNNYVELVHVALPTDVIASNPVYLDDIYVPAMQAYIVYYGLSEDMDNAANRDLSQTWFNQFVQLVTGKKMSEESLKRVKHNLP